jgi:hypothetical protein
MQMQWQSKYKNAVYVYIQYNPENAWLVINTVKMCTVTSSCAFLFFIQILRVICISIGILDTDIFDSEHDYSFRECECGERTLYLYMYCTI